MYPLLPVGCPAVGFEPATSRSRGGRPGNRIGTALKDAVHTSDTPYHLAFSCHIVRPDGQMLVTRRALKKRAWPGVWTNACCGHPMPDEHPRDAVLRRVRQELGLDVTDLQLVLPDFSYRAVDSGGIVEHELCPVWVASADRDPEPDPEEVDQWRWASPGHVAASLRTTPWAFSPWLVEQAPHLAVFGGRA